jgi:hypothetical protein
MAGMLALERTLSPSRTTFTGRSPAPRKRLYRLDVPGALRIIGLFSDPILGEKGLQARVPHKISVELEASASPERTGSMDC